MDGKAIQMQRNANQENPTKISLQYQHLFIFGGLCFFPVIPLEGNFDVYVKKAIGASAFLSLNCCM